MNGCQYCVIVHNRKRNGRKRARGAAMCLAQDEMTKCDKKRPERGPGCEHHDKKLLRFHTSSSSTSSQTQSNLSILS